MTENGKIYITKQSIKNLLSSQQLSIGLSLYILKDIISELQPLYYNIIQKQMQEIQEEQSHNEGQQFNIDTNSTIDSIVPLQD